MTRSLYEPSLWRATAKNGFGVKSLERRPLAMRWWQPDCTPGTDGCTGEEPVLQNFWAQPLAPLETFAFRLHADGSLEFKGHLDASGGATSGTVAVTLPGAIPGDAGFLLANDQYFSTVITEDGGASFTIALVFLDATTGDVTISWPAV